MHLCLLQFNVEKGKCAAIEKDEKGQPKEENWLCSVISQLHKRIISLLPKINTNYDLISNVGYFISYQNKQDEVFNQNERRKIKAFCTDLKYISLCKDWNKLELLMIV
jgi:hypothetical protein